MLRRILIVLATVAGLGIAATGVANANVPAIFVGSSSAFPSTCIGVILDQDGSYNVMDSSGNGYDAKVCTPSDTTRLGWNHAGGYYLGNRAEVEEDVFVNNAWQLARIVCIQNGTLTRFLDSTHFYRISRLSNC